MAAGDEGSGTALGARDVPTEVDVCAVSDALDRLGLHGAVGGLRCVSVPDRLLVGRVRTVSVAPRRDERPRPHLCTTTVMASGPGDVIVVGNRGRLDVSCWGGILSLAAQLRGIAGVVVDGACRDVTEAAILKFPVFARATTPCSARGRVVEESTGLPITIGAVEVREGDMVVADSTGVVFVPAERADEVLTLARQIAEYEARMADAVRSGVSIIDVMHDHRFDQIGKD